MLGADLEGEAREVAAEHAREARRHKAAGRRVALISGGELTVTIRGEGNGGPNQEYALALAIALAGEPASAASPPTPTAPMAVAARPPIGRRSRGRDHPGPRPRRRPRPGRDARRQRLDRFFAAIGDLVRPGPTLHQCQRLPHHPRRLIPPGCCDTASQVCCSAARCSPPCPPTGGSAPVQPDAEQGRNRAGLPGPAGLGHGGLVGPRAEGLRDPAARARWRPGSITSSRSTTRAAASGAGAR